MYGLILTRIPERSCVPLHSATIHAHAHSQNSSPAPASAKVSGQVKFYIVTVIICILMIIVKVCHSSVAPSSTTTTPMLSFTMAIASLITTISLIVSIMSSSITKIFTFTSTAVISTRASFIHYNILPF